MWRLRGWEAAVGGLEGGRVEAGGASPMHCQVLSTWLVPGCPRRVSLSQKGLFIPSLNSVSSWKSLARLPGAPLSRHLGHLAQSDVLCSIRTFQC